MRCSDNLFHPRKFVHNNINFRIKTSEAFSYFKMNQAFILKQMTYNTKFEFSLVAKDIMLLKYDVWYDWLNETEQILLTSCAERAEIKNDIIDSARQRKIYYEKTLRENFAGHDLEFINFWINIHNKVYDLLEEKILKINDLFSKEDFFFEITRITSNILKRTLYELQELETIFFDKGDVNLCVDNICIEIFRKDPSFIREKINSYLEIKHFNNIVIKNYSDIDDLSIICDNVLELLKEKNIEYYII